MFKRTYATLALWFFTIVILYFGGIQAGIWLLAVVVFFTQWEFYLLLEKMGYRPYCKFGLGLGIFFILATYYLSAQENQSVSSFGNELLAIAVTMMSLLIITKKGFTEKMRSLIPSLFGILYIPFLLHFLVCLALLFDPANFLPNTGLLMVLWVVIVAKFTDVGGLIVGKKWGKTQMAPQISPRKTWEGTIGGIVLSATVGTIFVAFFRSQMPENFSITKSFFYAIPLASLAIVSDLVESAMKRRAKVKDSGTSIPGIGGWFDLTDSIILTAPIAYLIIKYTILKV